MAKPHSLINQLGVSCGKAFDFLNCIVVALTMFDLRRREKVQKLGLCGTSGGKFPGIVWELCFVVLLF